METINYKNLEWYVINETDKEKLLFLKDCFTHEQILKYFKGIVSIDEYYDVQFNNDCSTVWWRDSPIRSVLNDEFLSDLDIKDLNLMETTVKLNGEEVTTKDYVRLITNKEVEVLDKVILCTSKKFGYWTMSPAYFVNQIANEFYVHNGDIDWTLTSISFGVRPVISLKKKSLDRGLIISDEEEMKKELKRVVSL